MLKFKRKKLVAIKTVARRLYERDKFDNEVNLYIKSGWKVSKFKTISADNDNDINTVLYARLELWEG